MPKTCVVVGHGRSPEGRGWGSRIDACDLVLRMWDNHWQTPADHGTKYDIGFYEASPAWMPKFWAHNKREPSGGWIASHWGSSVRRCKTPANTTFVDQVPWCRAAMAMGGHGLHEGRLNFTRGAIATCWLIEQSERGDRIVLVGFDNVRARLCLSIEDGYSEAYRKQPSTFSFASYVPGGPRHSNHDFSIEFPFMQRLAGERGVEIAFADEEWGGDAAKPVPKMIQPLCALVVGDAACVDEDVKAAIAMFEPDAVAATNNMIIRWPDRLDYAVTLHPDPCPNWCGIVDAVKRRTTEGRNLPETWAHKHHRGIDRFTKDWRGSTGLLCVKVLLEEGFRRIVLAGVPMSANEAHFYSPSERWKTANAYHKGWLDHRSELAPYVRSMSGWTRRMFGPPDAQWLKA